MDLSIIITTRNRLDCLLRCVESIKKADLKGISWELIVVDDCSGDGTKKLSVRSLKVPKAKIVHNSTQQMMVRSRNIGYRKSSGKYLLYIDDDNKVHKNMVKVLMTAAKNHPAYGILGPSMHYLKTRKRYMDLQRINFFTGRTVGSVDASKDKIVASDGIPNAFLIKREVFETCGVFDEKMIQTFTEPDFSFKAEVCGFKTGIVKKAKIFHDVSESNNLTPRALGGMYFQKAYCLMRNRSVLVYRYGNLLEKAVYVVLFSWFWPLLYSVLVLRYGRFDLIRLYWMGFRDGLIYFFTGKLISSL